jgi:hypothetical protein
MILCVFRIKIDRQTKQLPKPMVINSDDGELPATGEWCTCTCGRLSNRSENRCLFDSGSCE